ncbi:hypothetical protein FA95DRAFT_1566999 [Auriscalpium vulgare]|uniref:Uncharacterized protein n=1 Tax=Auriscalpium vulgare TaxID=40419 RepID=A0ACB8R6R5_9AGAM|nr:hypothetical protein FA95DRAFT_1566999 [Auriscalpium vulgare]
MPTTVNRIPAYAVLSGTASESILSLSFVLASPLLHDLRSSAELRVGHVFRATVTVDCTLASNIACDVDDWYSPDTGTIRVNGPPTRPRPPHPAASHSHRSHAGISLSPFASSSMP